MASLTANAASRGYVPLSQTGSELLFEVFSQRYERGGIHSGAARIGILLRPCTVYV